MPNTLTKTIISEGTQKAIIHFYMEGDGSGEWINEPLWDPATEFNTLASPQYSGDDGSSKQLLPDKLTIIKSWVSASWFDITLSFDGNIIVPVIVFARDADFTLDFGYFGGLKDRTNDNPTGRLLISTKDFANPGSNGFMVLEVKRN